MNGCLFIAFLSAQVFLLFLFPITFHHAPSLALAGLAVAALLVLPTWYLIHEAIHDHLDEDLKRGVWMGRILSVVSGVPFTGIRVAHLLHHRWNRIEEFSENFDAANAGWFTASVKYVFLILGGLYWVEFLGGLVCFLPESFCRWLSARLAGDNGYMKRVYSSMNSPANSYRIRNESGCIALSYVGAFYLYGMTLLPVLATVLAARAFLISFFDNSFHYDASTNPGDNSGGTRNHSLPASWFLLNFNYHWTHHKHPGAPWTELPRLAREDGAFFEGNYVFQSLRQLKGAIPMDQVRATARPKSFAPAQRPLRPAPPLMRERENGMMNL